MLGDTATSFRLPSLVTGSTWDNVAASFYQQMSRVRPQGHSGDKNGTVAPTLTNREAVSLLDEWRRAAGSVRFPLWYALAAPAYGWHEQGDDLDTHHGDDYYPADDAAILWPWLLRLAPLMDADGVKDPRIATDDVYDNTVLIAELRALLEHDGHSLDEMEAQYKFPIGCKKENIKIDPKTKLPYCDKAETVDDPIRGILKGIGRVLKEPAGLAVVIVIGWALYTHHLEES